MNRSEVNLNNTSASSIAEDSSSRRSVRTLKDILALAELEALEASHFAASLESGLHDSLNETNSRPSAPATHRSAELGPGGASGGDGDGAEDAAMSGISVRI